MNYQVLKGMSLKLREDSLMYGRKTIVTKGVDDSTILDYWTCFLSEINKYLLLSLLLSLLLN